VGKLESYEAGSEINIQWVISLAENTMNAKSVGVSFDTVDPDNDNIVTCPCIIAQNPIPLQNGKMSSSFTIPLSTSPGRYTFTMKFYDASNKLVDSEWPGLFTVTAQKMIPPIITIDQNNTVDTNSNTNSNSGLNTNSNSNNNGNSNNGNSNPSGSNGINSAKSQVSTASQNVIMYSLSFTLLLGMSVVSLLL